MTTFAGAFTALVTPFRDGKVDEQALRKLVDRQITAGIDGLVPCGTTGESVTLSGDEHRLVVRTVVEEVRGRVPVVAGAGTNSTTHTIELAETAKELGADGLLLVCPYYNKPTQAGLEAHFRTVMKAVPMPAMLYNIPGRTGIDLSVDTLARLADVPEIVAIKEATGNVVRSQQILARCGSRFDVLSGDDALSLSVMAVGGCGVVSVASNVLPSEVAEVARRMRKGDLAGARSLHLRLVPVYESMFVEANPGPCKWALADAGLIAAEIRQPLCWPEEASQQVVARALQSAGVSV